MKYFNFLYYYYCAAPGSKVQGLNEKEMKYLLLLHRSHDCDFPLAMKEFLGLFGKNRGHLNDGAFGEYDDFVSFKLAMIYELAELGLPLPKRTDFVFYNNQDYGFAYIDLSSTEEDPFVSLLITPKVGEELIVNHCRFSEYVYQYITKYIVDGHIPHSL